MTWVRFHGELRQGEKKGISRASRFIYLELSHESRPRRGFVVLPIGLSDVEATCELLGGSRGEVVKAIKELQLGTDPMIRFDDWQGKRILTVVNWGKWNPIGDDSGPRVRTHRAKLRRATEALNASDGNALQGVSETPSNGSVTDTSARARTNLSLSSPSGLDLPSEFERSKTATSEPRSGERFVATDDPLPEELRAAASMLGVRDIDSAWLSFCGKRAGQWVNLVGAWQAFCATWRSIERREPASGTRLRPAPPKQPPTGSWIVPKAVNAPDEPEKP